MARLAHRQRRTVAETNCATPAVDMFNNFVHYGNADLWWWAGASRLPLSRREIFKCHPVAPAFGGADNAPSSMAAFLLSVFAHFNPCAVVRGLFEALEPYANGTR